MTLPGSKEMSDTDARAHLAAILEFSEEAIVSSTPDGVITGWNRRAEEIFGWAMDEALGKSFALVVPENLGEELQVLRAKILEGERVQRLETVWLREDAPLELSFTFFGVVGHGGEVIAIDAMISVRKVKEGEEECKAAVERLSRERDRLYLSEQRLHKVIDLLPQLIWSATPDGTIDKINAFFRQYAGLGDGSEFLGETERLIRMVVHPDDAEAIRAAWQRAVSSGDSYEYAARIRRADGAYRWFMGRALPERDRDGQLVRWYGTASDIHDLKETQEKLRDEIESRLRAVEELRRQEQLLVRQGRLAAMGEMIANIAHQWRQPLNNLGLMLQELRMLHDRSLLDFEHLNGSVVKGMQIINYMSKTIDGFRNFFAPDKAKEPFNVAETISRTVALLEAGFSKLKLSIEMELAQEVEVYGYPNEFSQVILNILVNAKDTIVERGISEPRVTIKAFAVEGKAVVTVADNAGGITVEPIEKIFDPYFTTKGPDKGTGIGLFMSKMIIEQNMNGRLTVRNTEQGAEFTIEMSRVGDHGGCPG